MWGQQRSLIAVCASIMVRYAAALGQLRVKERVFGGDFVMLRDFQIIMQPCHSNGAGSV
jgi:hypothetical protein